MHHRYFIWFWSLSTNKVWLAVNRFCDKPVFQEQGCNSLLKSGGSVRHGHSSVVMSGGGTNIHIPFIAFSLQLNSTCKFTNNFQYNKQQCQVMIGLIYSWDKRALIAWKTTLYRVAQNGTVFWYTLTSSNINRFSKLFHFQNQEKMCNKTITKDPTTPQVCRYTTLWNVKCLKSNNWKHDDFCNNTFYRN